MDWTTWLAVLVAFLAIVWVWLRSGTDKFNTASLRRDNELLRAELTATLALSHDRSRMLVQRNVQINEANLKIEALERQCRMQASELSSAKAKPSHYLRDRDLRRQEFNPFDTLADSLLDVTREQEKPHG